MSHRSKKAPSVLSVSNAWPHGLFKANEPKSASSKSHSWTLLLMWNVGFFLELDSDSDSECQTRLKTFQSISTSRTDWMLTEFWLHIGCILATYWLHFDWILTDLAAFWLNFGCILIAFWLHFECFWQLFDCFWLHFHYFLDCLKIDLKRIKTVAKLNLLLFYC